MEDGKTIALQLCEISMRRKGQLCSLNGFSDVT